MARPVQRISEREILYDFELGFATIGIREDHTEKISAVTWEGALERGRFFALAHMMRLVRIQIVNISRLRR